MEQEQVKTLLQECKHYQDRMKYWHRKYDQAEEMFELYQEIVRDSVDPETYKKIRTRFMEVNKEE